MGLLGQLNQSMSQGTPALGQVTGQSPNFQPQLQPPAPSPMPDKSPASMIPKTALHRAFERRGKQIPPQLQNLGVGSNMPPSAAPQATGSTQPPQGVNVPVSEAELIIKALTSRLKTVGEHESAIRDALLPKNLGVGSNEH